MTKNSQTLDPIDMLGRLDVDELQVAIAREQIELDEWIAAKQKRIDAFRILLRAATVQRDGKPPRKQHKQKKGELGAGSSKDADRTPAASTTAATNDHRVPGLKPRLVVELRNAAARANVLADRMGVTEQQALAVLENDAAFEQGQRGYWRLSEKV